MDPFLSEKSRVVGNAALFCVYHAPHLRGEGQAWGISHGSIPCSPWESVHLPGSGLLPSFEDEVLADILAGGLESLRSGLMPLEAACLEHCWGHCVPLVPALTQQGTLCTPASIPPHGLFLPGLLSARRGGLNPPSPPHEMLDS